MTTMFGSATASQPMRLARLSRGRPGERFSPGLCCAIFDGGFAGDELSCSRGAVPVFLRTKQLTKRRAGLFAPRARVGLWASSSSSALVVEKAVSERLADVVALAVEHSRWHICRNVRARKCIHMHSACELSCFRSYAIASPNLRFHPPTSKLSHLHSLSFDVRLLLSSVGPRSISLMRLIQTS